MAEQHISVQMDLFEALQNTNEVFMKNKFQLRICSDLDYEEMVADISYDDHTLAMITQENGIKKMEIEVFPPDGKIKSWKFLLDDYVSAIISAKQTLIRMQKIEENNSPDKGS